jgi:hypothetical protein
MVLTGVSAADTLDVPYVFTTQNGNVTVALPTATPTLTATPTPTPLVASFVCSNVSADSSGPGPNGGFETDSGNACDDDGAIARDVDTGTNNNSDCADQGKDRTILHDFDISLAPTAVIYGIELGLDASGPSTSYLCAELSWNDEANWTASKTTPPLTPGLAISWLGGSSDDWGHNWTATQLSNANFHVRVTSVATSSPATISLDAVIVRIYYQP